MKVEILYIGKSTNFSRELELSAGSSVENALLESGILAFLQEEETEEGGVVVRNISDLNDRIGIFGKRVNLEYILSEGDRIEIYRPLIQDPKEARRKRAKELQKRERKS